MTEEQIWDWQCKMHIYSCYLYEVQNKPILKDEDYDQHCQLLLRAYDKLPKWYTDRITKDQLQTASAMGIEYTDEDIKGAYEWLKSVQHLIAG